TSIAYWIFPALIVLNAISIPLATPQVVLNVLLGIFYLSAGLLYPKIPLRSVRPPITLHSRARTNAPPGTVQASGITQTNSSQLPTNAIGIAANTNRFPRTNFAWMRDFDLPTAQEEITSRPDLSKVIVLWLLAACCYGAQVLRRTVEESRE